VTVPLLLVHFYWGTIPAAQPAGSAQGGVAADRGLVQFRCGGLLSLRSHCAACLRGALTRSGSGACVSSVESVARPVDPEELVRVLVALVPGVPLPAAARAPAPPFGRIQAGHLCSRPLADLRPPRPVILLGGLPATAGSLRRFQADSRAGSARDAEKPAVVMSNTYADLQVFYGSDGTRTRDLRRDRPVMVLPG